MGNIELMNFQYTTDADEVLTGGVLRLPFKNISQLKIQRRQELILRCVQEVLNAEEEKNVNPELFFNAINTTDYGVVNLEILFDMKCNF